MKKILAVLLLVSLSVFTLSAAEKDWIKKNLPTKLITNSKQKVDTNSVLTGKIIALYFSASWCPPCRSFTPQLVNFYNKVAKDENIEIILVPSDRSAKAMMKYMNDYKMSWPAIPFKNRFITKLKSTYGVRGIPALIVIDGNGRILSQNGRMDVVKHKEGAVKIWKAKMK